MTDSPVMGRLRRGVAAWAGLWFGGADSRVYALVRILFAAVSLISLIDLWPLRYTFLSPRGVIDRQTLIEAIGDDPYYSVFHVVDSDTGISAVCVCAGVAMVLLGLGVAPRVASVIVFLWHLSFSHATFPAAVGWDSVLRVYSFLVMISPLGAAWSLPAFWNRRRRSERPLHDAASPCYGLLLMRLQLVLIYFDTAWAKVNDEYWRSGQAIAYFMMSFYSSWPAAGWAEWSLTTCLMSYASLALEILLPVLLLTPKTRRGAVVLGVLFHAGIAVCSNLDLFTYAMIAAYAVFLEGADIDWIASRREF